MFEQWNAIRKAKKEAAKKAKELYLKELKLEKARKAFLNENDSPNFIAEVVKGCEGMQNVKVIYIKKTNGTTITIPLTSDNQEKQKELDWIDFESLTDSQGVMRLK
jgi:hypothetical protein